MNITDPIRRYARLTPDAVAIIRPNHVKVTYLELDRTIDSLGRHLLGLGLVAGNTAAMRINEDPYRFLLLSLAFARMGVTGAPFFMRPGIDLCLVDSSLQAPNDVRAATLDPAWTETPPADAKIEPVPALQDGAAICRIFPSSGTTGVPRFMAVSHDMLARRVFLKWLATRLPDDVRQICAIGTGTHYGYFTQLRVLWTGGQVVMPGRQDQIVPFIDRYGVSALVIAPIALQTVLSARPVGSAPLSSLRLIEVGGSALSKRLYDLARASLCESIISNYGATETASIAAGPLSLLQNHPGAVGYVNPGVEVQAVDEQDVPVRAGEEGILRVRSPGCVAGYIGGGVESALVFKGGWVYPGDMGSVSSEGLLTVTGRVVDVINSGGIKVSPQRIEEVLLSIESIRDAAAFGAPDAMDVTQIWAAIVPDGALDIDAIRAICRERLGASAPTRFLQCRELPRNPNGKVIRDALRKSAASANQA